MRALSSSIRNIFATTNRKVRVIAIAIGCLAPLPGLMAADTTNVRKSTPRFEHASISSSGMWSNPRRMRLAGPYSARVLAIIDGDTFVARIPVWIGQEVTTHVRLRGIDAPELKGRCAAETRLALEARQALADILASGRINLRDIGTGKYAGRVIARVFVTSKHDHNTEEAGAMLLAAGYARPYRGGRRDDWCPESFVKR